MLVLVEVAVVEKWITSRRTGAREAEKWDFLGKKWEGHFSLEILLFIFRWMFLTKFSLLLRNVSLANKWENHTRNLTEFDIGKMCYWFEMDHLINHFAYIVDNIQTCMHIFFVLQPWVTCLVFHDYVRSMWVYHAIIIYHWENWDTFLTPPPIDYF